MAIKLGTAGNDLVNGTAGWDTLYGLAGNDTLLGSTGGDILSGGLGNDILEGGAGADSLNGGTGADVFRYANFSDADRDSISDFSTEDSISFSAIADASFIGNAQFTGVAGQIRYFNYGFGSSSYLRIDSDGDAQGDIFLYFTGSINFAETATGSRILKTATNQTLIGTALGETLNGGVGNDTLSGLSGGDILTGGEGHDILLGGDGNDRLIGGIGIDTLTGGAGADVFRFNSPDDFYLAGDPFFGYIGTPVGDVITDFGRSDKIVLAFQGLSFIGGAAFSGVPGQYRYGYSDDFFYGNDGRFKDKLLFDFDGDKTVDTFIALNDLFASKIALEETVAGSNQLTIAANLNLIGTAGNDIQKGGNGFDTITGGTGNDRLLGGQSNDTLSGGDGQDVLVGGLGGDIMTGGLNADVFRYSSLDDFDGTSLGFPFGNNIDVITDLTLGDKIDLSAIAGLTFVGVGNDFSGVANQIKVINSSSANTTWIVIDTDGNAYSTYQDATLQISGNLNLEETSVGSRIFQVVANKLLNGTTASDTLTGGNGNDVLNGLAGNDQLTAGFGNDRLNGGDGADTLIGGLGSDMLTGGAGNDIFKFNSLADLKDFTDSITDFVFGDKIDISAIDANTTIAGDQAFSLIENPNFSGNAGELYYYDTFGYGRLYADIDGDQYSDFSIEINGPPNLNASSFFL